MGICHVWCYIYIPLEYGNMHCTITQTYSNHINDVQDQRRHLLRLQSLQLSIGFGGCSATLLQLLLEQRKPQDSRWSLSIIIIISINTVSYLLLPVNIHTWSSWHIQNILVIIWLYYLYTIIINHCDPSNEQKILLELDFLLFSTNFAFEGNYPSLLIWFHLFLHIVQAHG